MKKAALIAFLVIFISQLSLSQSANFNLDQYKTFLNTHQNLSYQDLLTMFDAGKFENRIKNFPSNVLFLDSIQQKLKLSNYEKELLYKNGFFVTERITNVDFVNMLLRVWYDDLPVFISTDAILNAFHQSYDLILKGTEISSLIPKLEEFLNILYSDFAFLENKYSSIQELNTMLKDIDVYLTIPRKLMNDNAQPFYSDNISDVNRFMDNIQGLTFIEEPFFSKVNRKVDYSQFKPRGHYTDINYPQLARYFKAMIWLGRMELYLISPSSADIKPIDEDTQRQIIDSFLISELINNSGASVIYNEIEKIILAFVGEQDNVTLPQLNSVLNTVHVSSANDFLNQTVIGKFQDTLSTKSYAGQKILSQLLESNPFDLTQIKPASSFLLFGQRFVIDSYVTGNVVYDRIIFNNQKISRMLPSTLDILFALGNSAAAQILKPEIDQYHYATNLSSLRYLIDSYDQDFWNNSIYNLWLNSIRTLNSPSERINLPQFMQTAAWWQQKMNSQLASWAELRHDNILYAKQSYTGMVICSYPFSYVEPIPDFYKAMKNLATISIEKFNSLSINMEKEKNYFSGFAQVMDTLETISKKELDNITFSEDEKRFLRTILFQFPGCGTQPDGWYARKLIYKNYSIGTANQPDHIVADYHTSATDDNGTLVGWVKHSGTGPANLCVVVADLPNIGSVAFAGPVSSYYEYTTTNFLRLTDEEWKQTYLAKSLRPDWINIYIANDMGESKGTGRSLITDIKENELKNELSPDYSISISNYPNPFNPNTTIVFNVPQSLSDNQTELNIYNVNGELIKKLLKKELPSGNYLVRWDGTNDFDNTVSSGIYFYYLKIGSHLKTGKMNLLK